MLPLPAAGNPRARQRAVLRGGGRARRSARHYRLPAGNGGDQAHTRRRRSAAGENPDLRCPPYFLPLPETRPRSGLPPLRGKPHHQVRQQHRNRGRPKLLHPRPRHANHHPRRTQSPPRLREPERRAHRRPRTGRVGDRPHSASQADPAPDHPRPCGFPAKGHRDHHPLQGRHALRPRLRIPHVPRI